MSEAADVRAEILKLSRDPEDLGSLAPAPSVDVRRVRERLTDVRFDARGDVALDAHGHALGWLAAASKLLPVGLIALLAERAFGPVLAARVAGMLEPSRAIAVATKLPTMFLADVATHIDPRRGSNVIAGIPPALIAEVTRELARRGEFVTIGRLVGQLGTEATAAALDAMNPTTAPQFGAAGQPRSRVRFFLALAALVTLVAGIGVVVVTFEGAATSEKQQREIHVTGVARFARWEERPSEPAVICRRPAVVASAPSRDHRQSRRPGRRRYRNRGEPVVRCSTEDVLCQARRRFAGRATGLADAGLPSRRPVSTSGAR